MIRMFSLYKTNSLLYKRALNQFLKNPTFVLGPLASDATSVHFRDLGNGRT